MTIVLYDDIFLEHDTGDGHPENALRLSNTVSFLKSTGMWERSRVDKPRKATLDEVCAVHDTGYAISIEPLAQTGGGWLDGDTYVSSRSSEATLYAAGAPLTAIDEIMQEGGGGATNAFCLVRPPGHHATLSMGMGFCLFNNVAIAAKYLQDKFGIGRVLIVDWDVHHGNGTQEVFYEDPSVLYFSMHRYPFYPGTGGHSETGSGKGEGFTINMALSDNTDRELYMKMFRDVMEKSAKEFRPQFILVSAGFDAYKYDPIGGLGLELEDFYELTKITMGLANDCCSGRIVSCLEGGYHPTDLPKCIELHLMALIEQG